MLSAVQSIGFHEPPAYAQATLEQCQAVIATLTQRLQDTTTRELALLDKWAKQAHTIDALKTRLRALQGEMTHLQMALTVAEDRAAVLQQLLTTQTRVQEVGL
jgi:septal ring factor EnvC (AmiA/AmiB activator)